MRCAGGIVLSPQRRVALVAHPNGVWGFPKGHLEKGESELDAAEREVREETGLKDLVFIEELGSYERPRIGKDPSVDDESELKEITMFLFEAEEVALQPKDKRHEEARWAPIDAVATILTHPKDEAFFESVKRKL